jgi:hypothetical protein
MHVARMSQKASTITLESKKAVKTTPHIDGDCSEYPVLPTLCYAGTPRHLTSTNQHAGLRVPLIIFFTQTPAHAHKHATHNKYACNTHTCKHTSATAFDADRNSS